MLKLFTLLCGAVCALTACGNNNAVMPPRDNVGTEIYMGIDEGNVSFPAAGGGLNNKKQGWGFKKVPGKAPDIAQETIDMIKRYDGFYLGDTSKKVLYLTFDQGYENGYTAPILDTLKKHSVPAAFFIVGHYFDSEKDLIRRMVDEGHIVGNHTDKHPSMPSVTDDEKLKKEITTLTEKFTAEYGKEMKYFRPPMGEYSERTLSITQSLGYKTAFWSSAYADWDVDKQKGEEYAFKMITEQFHDGSVILLHSVSKDNAAALERVILEAKAQGYEFKSLDDI